MFKSKELLEIVIVDFGISNFYKNNESIEIFGMSIDYCPPEITFSNLSHISPKADIFSFGMLFIIIFIIY